MTYNVGDIVRILPTPPDNEQMEDIWVGWVGKMDKYCGMEAIINEVQFDEAEGEYYYRINLDNGRLVWCNECFTDIAEAHEPELDETDLFAMLNM